MIPNVNNGRMLAATPRILPAVYDEAMTYLEQLRILNNKLNEVIDVFNSYGDELLTESKEYTDTQVELLRIQFEADIKHIQDEVANGLSDLEMRLQAALNDFEERAEEEFAWFRQRADELFTLFIEETTKLNENIANLQVSVNTLFDALVRTKLEMRQEMEKQIQEIMAYLDQALAFKTGNQIMVMNPVVMKITSLNVALEALADVTKFMFSLTVDEYKSLHLTADEYRALKITASDYLYKARWMFIGELYFPDLNERFDQVYGYINSEVEALDKNHYMVSPFDGVVTPVKRVVYELATLHMDGITADQYQNLALTADQYKEKEITAHDYAWNGYFILVTGAKPKETLQEEIEELQQLVASLTQRVVALENGATPSREIAAMKLNIQQNAYAITQAENEIHQNAEDQHDVNVQFQNDIDYINNTMIPNAVEGLHDTLSTVDSSLQTQITGIADGLQSIHIKY